MNLIYRGSTAHMQRTVVSRFNVIYSGYYDTNKISNYSLINGFMHHLLSVQRFPYLNLIKERKMQI